MNTLLHSNICCYFHK